MVQKGANKKDNLPPLDKKEIERLKREASTAKFTAVSFKVHKNKCNDGIKEVDACGTGV